MILANAILGGPDTAIQAAFKRALAARKIVVEDLPTLKEPDAFDVFREVRWADTDGRPTCPHCGAERPWALNSRFGVYRCRNARCRMQFSSTTKTVFRSRKLPMPLVLFSLASTGNTDLNASRLCEQTGVSYKTALSLAHRLGLPDGRSQRGNIQDLKGANYPFRASHSRAPGGDLLAEINSHVPLSLPPEMRADVCQEIALAVLCGDVQRGNIAEAAPTYILRYNRMFRGKYADLSLDAAIPGTDGLRLGDTIAGERMFEHWERR